MTRWSQDVYNKAWNFVCEAHKAQHMPGSDVPYVKHIGTVTMEVMSAIAATDAVQEPDLAVQCALLHDVIEDTPVTYEQVRAEFGEAVADGVLALTKNLELPTKAEQMRDSLRRIQDRPYEVWIVKLADRIANLQEPPPYWTSEKIRQYQQEAMLIYDTLKDANRLLAERLAQKIDEYRRFFNSNL
jgi:(p)ppGpp synthase/HD superfamily hydrolase